MSAPHTLTAAKALHARILETHAAYRQSERDLAEQLASMADGLYLHLGYASIVAYGERELDLSLRQTRALVRIGRHLPQLPALDAAFAAGELGWTKAREIVRVATPDTEAAWVERAKEVTSRDLERHVAAAQIGDAPPEDGDAKAPLRHRLVYEADAQDADAIRAALEMLRAAAGVSRDEVGDGALLAEMARRVLHDAEPGQAPTAERYRTVLEHCPRCRHTAGVHAEVRDTHVGLAECDGEVQEMRPGPKRGHVGRVVPPATRRAVLHRDRWRCTVPGCCNDLWLDLHHLHPRHLGGDHAESNLITLCSVHHRAAHEGLLAIERRGGDLRFERADGVVVGDPRGAPRRDDTSGDGDSASRPDEAGGDDPRGSDPDRMDAAA